MFKSDYYLNSKNSFTGTYNYISNPTDRPDQGAFYTHGSAGQQHHQGPPAGAELALDGVATLTNEVRGGFMRSDTAFLDSNEYPKSDRRPVCFSATR